MKSILFRILGRASDLTNVEPVIALFLGAAFLAVFFAMSLQFTPQWASRRRASLLWTLYEHGLRALGALFHVTLLIVAVSVLRIYLRQAANHFQQTHGRITQANYDAVQTIWGAEQEQGDLKVEIYTDEEVTERFEPEDVTKPAVLRKKIVRHPVTANPF